MAIRITQVRLDGIQQNLVGGWEMGQEGTQRIFISHSHSHVYELMTIHLL